MRMIENGAVRLAAEAFGNPDHPALLLVMGATASMLHWPEAFCEALAARGLHVIRFDHRDTGASTTVAPGAARYAVEDLLGDALAVLAGYAVAQAHVVGMSLGGMVAQMLAARHPAKVASLVLIGSEPLGWDGAALPGISEKFMDHFGALAALDWSDRGAVVAFLVESERLCAGSGASFDAERERVLAERVLARTGSPASMFNHGTLTLRDDWTGAFRQITTPTLVIHGAEDPILPVDNGRALADGIPGASLMVLPGVGHELPARAVPQMVAAIARLAMA